MFLRNNVYAFHVLVSVPVEKLRGFCAGISMSLDINERGKLTLWLFMSVFGGLVSCYEGMPLFAPLLLESKFLSSDWLASCNGNYDAPLELSRQVVENLNTLATDIFRLTGFSVLPLRRPQLCIATEASNSGWVGGAVIL